MAVELRLDTADWEKFAGDHYVSVRVGECQKLSKVAASRTYKFPATAVGSRRYGRVEVFRRVGAGAVCIDPQVAGGTNEVSVSFENTAINFEVSLNGDKPTPAPQPVKAAFPEADKLSRAEKAQQKAKEYLEQHHLEVRLSEAMQAVLRERPADPAAFLAKRLMENGELVAKLPTQKKAKDAAAEPAPVQAKAAPTVSLTPFSQYYTANINVGAMDGAFNSLYAKFGKAKAAAPANTEAPKATAKPFTAKPFSEYYTANVLSTTSLEGIHKRFAAYNARAPTKASPGPPVMKPFAGYYNESMKTAPTDAMESIYARFPKCVEAKEKAAPSAAPAAPGVPFAMKASVGTWCQPLRRGPACAAALKATPAPAAPAAGEYNFKPSVGTWLMPKKATAPAASAAATAPAAAPATGPAPVVFHEKPSVGSWYNPLRKSPQQAAGLVVSAAPAKPAPAPAKAAPAATLAPAASVPPGYPLPEGQQSYMTLRTSMFGAGFYTMGMAQGVFVM